MQENHPVVLGRSVVWKVLSWVRIPLRGPIEWLSLIFGQVGGHQTDSTTYRCRGDIVAHHACVQGDGVVALLSQNCGYL